MRAFRGLWVVLGMWVVLFGLVMAWERVYGDWEDMEVTRVSMYIEGEFVDSAGMGGEMAPSNFGISFIGTNSSGDINYIQVSGSLVLDGVVWYYQRQIRVRGRASSGKVLYGELWDGEKWVEGVTVHMYQIQREKLKFLLEYGEYGEVEIYAVNSESSESSESSERSRSYLWSD